MLLLVYAYAQSGRDLGNEDLVFVDDDIRHLVLFMSKIDSLYGNTKKKLKN